MSTTARGRAASAAALAVAVCASVAACGPGVGGDGDALPTYVAPSTSTTAPSPTTSGGKASGSIPSAKDLITQAHGQTRVSSTVTVTATLPGDKKAGKDDLGPLEIRAEGDAGGGATETVVTLKDGSSITQRDRGEGEVYLKVEHGPGGSADVEKGLEDGAKNPLAKRAGTWVYVYSFTNEQAIVPYRPFELLTSSVIGGTLSQYEQKYAVVDSRRDSDGTEVWAVLVRQTNASKDKNVRTLLLSKENPPRYLEYRSGRWPNQKRIDYTRWDRSRSTFDVPDSFVKLADASTVGTFGPRKD